MRNRVNIQLNISDGNIETKNNVNSNKAAPKLSLKNILPT